MARGRSIAYKRQLFQSFFVGASDTLVGSDDYRSWSDWTNDMLRKMGKGGETVEERSSYTVVPVVDAAIAVLDRDHERVIRCDGGSF